MLRVPTPNRLHGHANKASVSQWLARTGILLIALAIAGAVQWHRASFALAWTIESSLRDAAMAATADMRPDPRLAIVDIDEASIAQIGPWPWPRQHLATLAERLLSEHGAALVVFDLVLTDTEGRREGRPAAQRISAASGDARLLAMARARKLVAAQAFDYVHRESVTATGAVGGAIAGALPQPAGASATRIKESTAPAASATGYIGNFAELADSPCIGNIGFTPDPDGRIRKLALLTTWQRQQFPTLALAALHCLRPLGDMAGLMRRLPVDESGRWSVPFRTHPDSLLSVTAGSVMALEPDAQPRAGSAPATGRLTPAIAHRLEGRIVLVGSSALGLADRVATPLSANAAGVTVHAAALTALLDAAEGLSGPAPADWLMPAWSIVSILALWLCVAAAGLRTVTAALALILTLWAALATWLAVQGSTQVISAAAWGYASILLLHLPMEWSWVRTRLRRRNRLLSRYVAQPVLNELLASKAADPLQPRRAEITVLIADMQDYTRLTNHSDLAQAAQLTKGFLEQLTLPVLAHRGTLDRYTGDGLVAFWGAPIAEADHADRAIDAAREILANVNRFNAQRAQAGLPVANVRMGIASGTALVGDLGTPFRIAYTAVGDCINLASRLQQASRDVGVHILVSGSAASRCKRNQLTAIGTVAVRGLPDESIFTP